MYTIAKLFGKSPFAPLQNHMQKVSDCVDLLSDLLKAFEASDIEKMDKLSKKISELEHEADLTKNDIRNNLPKSIFLPIDRGALLEILSLQDSLADQAEDIAITATIKKLENYSHLKEDFAPFYAKNLESFYKVKEVILEIEALLETSFGGVEAQKTKEFIDQVAFLEHEVDRLQYKIIKKLYKLADSMPYSDFHLWMKLLKEVGAISNLSEKLANRVRMILELK